MPSATGQVWARRSGVAALLTAILGAVLSRWSPQIACGSLPAGYPPILAFELARSSADLAEVFGPPGPCRDAMVNAFHAVNLLDLAYMPAYGAFLWCALAALRTTASPGASRLLALGSYAAFIAPLCDLLENVCLLSMSLEQPGAWIFVLMIATRAKFILLGVASLALGVGFLRFERGAFRLLCIAHFPVLPIVIPAVSIASWMPALLPIFAPAWLATAVWAAVRSWRA